MFFSEQKAAFNESFTGEDEMPFLCAMKDGQKGGSRGRRWRRKGRMRGVGEKNNEEEKGGKGRKLFSLYFLIQRHFDRAEPTLWRGVEPF